MAGRLEKGSEAGEEGAKTFSVAGVQLPSCPPFSPEGAARVLALRPQPGDVILSSYPRCDSPHVDAILWGLLYPDLPRPPLEGATGRFLPCLEMSGAEERMRETQQATRLHKTYLPFRLLPFYKRTKYVYLMRAPWRTCEAYFRFLSSIGGVVDCSFDSFFVRFMEGGLPYGSYFRHVAPWEKRLADSNVLLLCREHVEHNPRSALYKIAAFLGDPHLFALLADDRLEGRILGGLSPTTPLSGNRTLSKCSFDFEDSGEEEEGEGAPPSSCCSQSQLSEMLTAVRSQFRNSSLEFLWLNLLQQELPMLHG